MSTSSVRTAQILRFPAGGRKAPTQGKQQTAPVSDLEIQAATAAVSDAWYHETAIQDAKLGGGR